MDGTGTEVAWVILCPGNPAAAGRSPAAAGASLLLAPQCLDTDFLHAAGVLHRAYLDEMQFRALKEGHTFATSKPPTFELVHKVGYAGHLVG